MTRGKSREWAMLRESFPKSHWKAGSPSLRWWMSVPHCKPRMIGLLWDYSGSLICVPHRCGLMMTDSLHGTSAWREVTPSFYTQPEIEMQKMPEGLLYQMWAHRRELASSSFLPTHEATMVYACGVGASVEFCPCACMNLNFVEWLGSARAFSPI